MSLLACINCHEKQFICSICGLCHTCFSVCVLQHSFSAVIHFAGLKAVGESVEKPLLYYKVNLTAFMNLLEVSQ